MAVKRVLDLVVSVAALTLLTPVMAVLALLVRLNLGEPILFLQLRSGCNERSFTIFKFRTMTCERSSSGRTLPDADRLTTFGAHLRAWSLDELPELWNVVRGDMSLVGPRPLPVAYLPRYTAEERRRHEVRPGLTGWAQVNGRNTRSWDERLAMDVWYVDHRSFWLDLRILPRTVSTVLRRDGVSAEGEATMAELRPPSERP